ncbi:MAG: hypothetical protein Q8P42_15970 [Gallionella sp.]|nr:hypothetical protein [Gallionella sp.]
MNLSRYFRLFAAVLVLCMGWVSTAQAAPGSGVVTSSPSGIDCSIDCTGFFDDGATVTLTATPAVGSYFAGWGGDCTGTGNCVLIVDVDKDVTVTFSALQVAPPSCTLSASPASITQGDSSTLTASCSPIADSYNWSANTGCDATSASCTVAPAETEIYTVTGSNAGGAGASASVAVSVTQPAPNCTLVYSAGSLVSGKTGTLTASCSPAATSYTWSDAGCASSSASCAVAPAVTTTYTVKGSNAGGSGNTASATATVTPVKPLLSVTLSDTGYGNVTSDKGTISCYAPEPNAGNPVEPDCTESYTSTAQVTLTATPSDDKNYFYGWSGDCAGTAPCVLTMNAAKNVIAIFKPVPFVATTTSDITAASATISTTLAFNVADVGKQGSIFITAWAPLDGLAALGISATALGSTMRVTATSANPFLTGKVNSRQVDMATLAATDPNAFVLVQLTSTGWELVVDGQLIPYATGVLGDALAAQSILRDADPTNLLGAQFCVGYGTSAAEMIATGRMIPVATIPDAGATAATNGSCNVAANPYKGLWYNASESGWGMSVTQHDSINFVALYTYDTSAQPVWYVMSDCRIATAGSCSGDIYQVVGGKAPTQPWVALDFAQALSTAGSGTLTFSDPNNGKFDFTLNGVTGSKTIERQMFSSGTAAQALDYTDLWWNANESGWGVALTQDKGMIFATWYAYDAAGLPVWYVASSCPLSGSGCTGEVYKVTGGEALTATWNGINPVATVGTVTFAFSDGGTGTMSYTIDGVSGSKAITRQSF